MTGKWDGCREWILSRKKTIVIVLVVLIVGVFGIRYIQQRHLEKVFRTQITAARLSGQTYVQMANDENRTEYVKQLKALADLYGTVREKEEGADIIQDILTSSYDILETDKEQAALLGDLVDGLQVLEWDIYDESGQAYLCFLEFVKANKS